MRAGAVLPLALLAVSGCVTVPPELLPVAHNPSGSAARDFEDIGPDVRLVPSPRFIVHAHDELLARRVSALAEKDYEQLMLDTGLFSFRPLGLYPIIVYAESGEYHHKTGQPLWSGGASVGNAVYTYDGEELEPTLAHELTHLIFYEYMGERPQLRWLNEGLAVYEELRSSSPEEKREIESWSEAAAASPIPFAMLAETGPGERAPVRLWYREAAPVAPFPVQTRGRGRSWGAPTSAVGCRVGRPASTSARRRSWPPSWECSRS